MKRFNAPRVLVSRVAAEALPPARVSRSTREQTAENYAAARRYFQRPSDATIRRAIAERDAPVYSEQWERFRTAPVDPVSDEEIGRLHAVLRAPAKRPVKVSRGVIRVVGMSEERALQIALEAMDAQR